MSANRQILKQGEYIGHEVYFPEYVPPEMIDKLKSYNFSKSPDGFYIPIESYELFCLLVFPCKVGILQHSIILGGVIDLEARQNQILDLANELKNAGVEGVGAWLRKFETDA